MVKTVMDGLHKALGTFPVGGADYKAVHSALKALIPVFGNSEGQGLVPAGIAQLAAAGKSGSPIAGAPTPGLAQAPPPGGGGAPPAPPMAA